MDRLEFPASFAELESESFTISDLNIYLFTMSAFDPKQTFAFIAVADIWGDELGPKIP